MSSSQASCRKPPDVLTAQQSALRPRSCRGETSAASLEVALASPQDAVLHIIQAHLQHSLSLPLSLCLSFSSSPPSSSCSSSSSCKICGASTRCPRVQGPTPSCQACPVMKDSPPMDCCGLLHRGLPHQKVKRCVLPQQVVTAFGFVFLPRRRLFGACPQPGQIDDSTALGVRHFGPLLFETPRCLLRRSLGL